jgi:hypothetical protein
VGPRKVRIDLKINKAVLCCDPEIASIGKSNDPLVEWFEGLKLSYIGTKIPI